MLTASFSCLRHTKHVDRLIDAHLSSMNYDANKLPLGKLAKSTILNGFAALKVCISFLR